MKRLPFLGRRPRCFRNRKEEICFGKKEHLNKKHSSFSSFEINRLARQKLKLVVARRKKKWKSYLPPTPRFLLSPSIPLILQKKIVKSSYFFHHKNPVRSEKNRGDKFLLKPQNNRSLRLTLGKNPLLLSLSLSLPYACNVER